MYEFIVLQRLGGNFLLLSHRNSIPCVNRYRIYILLEGMPQKRHLPECCSSPPQDGSYQLPNRETGPASCVFGWCCHFFLRSYLLSASANPSGCAVPFFLSAHAAVDVTFGICCGPDLRRSATNNRAQPIFPVFFLPAYASEETHAKDKISDTHTYILARHPSSFAVV